MKSVITKTGQFEHIAYFDGASQGNPGPSGVGGVIMDSEGKILCEISEFIGVGTNNEAEYKALIAIARRLSEMGVQSALIKGDSQLVVNQVNGDWRINHEHLYSLCNKALKELDAIPRWSLEWVPRESNAHADRLSSGALSISAKPKSLFNGLLEHVAGSIYLAHGTGIYAVDVGHGACTCPAFTGGKTRPCKHLVAAARVSQNQNNKGGV